MKTLITVLKWILFIPIGLIAGALCNIMINFVAKFSSGEGSWNLEYITPVFGMFVGASATMIMWISIVPSYKKGITYLLLIIALLLCISDIYLNFRDQIIFDGIKSISAFFGFCAGFSIIYNKDYEISLDNI
jgi:hypothetical protein